MEKIQLQLIIDKLSHLGEPLPKSGITKALNGNKDRKTSNDKSPNSKRKAKGSHQSPKTGKGGSEVTSPSSNANQEKDELVKEIERYSKPIYYQGKQITTYSDILEHLDLNLLNKESIRDAQKDIAEKGIFDE